MSLFPSKLRLYFRPITFQFKSFATHENNLIRGKVIDVKCLLKTPISKLPIDCLTKGWIRNIRKQKNLVFLNIADGSCLRNEKLQVIFNRSDINRVGFGDAVCVTGKLVKSSHPGQLLEIQGESLQILGPFNANTFPMKAKQSFSLKTLRNLPHLRPLNPAFASLLRVRSECQLLIHKFFKENNFFNVHSPVLTSNDCEGAGEIFSVQSLSEKENLFFDKPVYLTVSSQLHLEALSNGLEKVYTLGPTFRAENSNTRQHLSEFWMLEAEQEFTANLDELVQVVERLIKFVISGLLETCDDDMTLLLGECVDPQHYHRLSLLSGNTQFNRITYLEALDILNRHRSKFQWSEIKFGNDLGTEQESFLVEHFGRLPLVVTHYPTSLKPFYMKPTDENKQTVDCFDILVPFGGEVCGGSLRQHNYAALKEKLDEINMTQSLDWYLDLRNYGSSPHGGFGCGFERLIQFCIGAGNIRDVIQFPRWSHHCQN